jgi:hypothetical protein
MHYDSATCVAFHSPFSFCCLCKDVCLCLTCEIRELKMEEVSVSRCSDVVSWDVRKI